MQVNSALLNIWRETGSYLRYGDAKALFMLGLSSASFYSLVHFLLLGAPPSWGIFGRLMIAKIGTNGWVCVIFLLLSIIVAAASIIPTLTRGAVRVRIFIGIADLLSSADADTSREGITYFRDIARFKSSTLYLDDLKKKNVLSCDVSAADEDLVEQIWVVSRIAFSKFIAVNLSILFLTLGVVMALITV
jgi:hypothetical protein